MRHLTFGQKLSRDTNARKALANNLASGLFDKGKITTTLAKANFARPYVEKLITLAKTSKIKDNRRLASLVTKSAFFKLTREIGPGFNNRPGGYTRIVKLVPRVGDAAPMARIELLPVERSKKLAATVSTDLASEASAKSSVVDKIKARAKRK